MSEKIICEKCGAEMQPHHKGSTCGMLCPKCGWGWVTTYSSPIDADETMYTISFCKPEKATAAMVKLYAKLTGANFTQAKKALEEGNAAFSALAADIQKYIEKIHATGVQFDITPDYPYDIDGLHGKQDHEH